jgi:polygalacturonase
MRIRTLSLLLVSSALVISCACGETSACRSVCDFGARGDGISLDTAAVNRAIEAAAAEGRAMIEFLADEYL